MDILWVVQQVQLEGIGDLINVPVWMKKPSETWSASNKQYVDFYRKSPEIIRAMDGLFSRMQDGQDDRRDLGQQLRRAVPRSGHPTGYFMAETIVAVLGKEALVRTVANPFAFFRLYGEAARKKGGDTPGFSKKTLDLIRSLEKRYGQWRAPTEPPTAWPRARRVSPGEVWARARHPPRPGRSGRRTGDLGGLLLL
jgi:hypothetical protein